MNIIKYGVDHPIVENLGSRQHNLSKVYDAFQVKLLTY